MLVRFYFSGLRVLLVSSVILVVPLRALSLSSNDLSKSLLAGRFEAIPALKTSNRVCTDSGESAAEQADRIFDVEVRLASRCDGYDLPEAGVHGLGIVISRCDKVSVSGFSSGTSAGGVSLREASGCQSQSGKLSDSKVNKIAMAGDWIGILSESNRKAVGVSFAKSGCCRQKEIRIGWRW